MIKSRSYYVTSMEAAQMLGFSQDHIRRLILDGVIKAQKIGPNWIIKKTDLKGIKRRRFPRAAKTE